MSAFVERVLNRIKKALAKVNDIQRGVIIGPKAFIQGTKITKGAVIGEGCRLYQATINGNVKIGRFSSIWGPNTYVLAKVNKIIIGNFCSVARNVTIQEFNHNHNKLTSYYIGENIFKEKWENEAISKNDIIIGNDVWIGAHCVILSGSTIGNGVVVAAHSLVNGNIPDYAIVAGSPAKVLRYRFDEETIKYLSELKWWDWSEEKIRENKHLFIDNYKMDNI
jgi:acetyltransferase-like isoleucine patch superfamily enzyme